MHWREKPLDVLQSWLTLKNKIRESCRSSREERFSVEEQKVNRRNFPSGLALRTPLQFQPIQGVWVQSLDRELTSHMLQGTVKSFVFKTSTRDFLSLRFYSLCHTVQWSCMDVRVGL